MRLFTCNLSIPYKEQIWARFQGREDEQQSRLPVTEQIAGAAPVTPAISNCSYSVKRKHNRILFVLKKHDYWPSFGLRNSCQFIADALTAEGVYTKVVEVVDNNDIDREVTDFDPDLVIVEALWVVPEKFPVLMSLHPKVKWVVRIHSNLPFLSGEGMALTWLKHYIALSVQDSRFVVAANGHKIVDDFYRSLGWPLTLLPNIYFPSFSDAPLRITDKSLRRSINIGCFGAIRPLKNNLEQAVAAVAFANEQHVTLNFHVNSTRVEQNSDPVLRNLEALFQDSPHTLVKHLWQPHDQFIHTVRSMDYGMQVSFSETFNIVAADFAYNEVPFVGSSEIDWLSPHSQARTTDVPDIVEKLGGCARNHVVRKNKLSLRDYSERALNRWLEFLE